MDKLVLEILDKAIFYKYFEKDFKDFYGKISVILINLDEKLVGSSEHNISKPLFRKYKEEINNLINELYSELKIYYSEI